MKWIEQFDLFLFDLDGLLVNTEPLHYAAYVRMLAERGYRLNLTFIDFCRLAHLNATAWRKALYDTIPGLDSDWDLLYREKKEAYLKLLVEEPIELMAGAEPLLKALNDADIKRCVVTHSPREQVELIRKRVPVLQTIAHWITREDYAHPKPHPSCYLQAIQKLGKKGDRIIGFEDSMRGWSALSQTPAFAVLVCPSSHPLLKENPEGKKVHIESLQRIEDLMQK